MCSSSMSGPLPTGGRSSGSGQRPDSAPPPWTPPPRSRASGRSLPRTLRRRSAGRRPSIPREPPRSTSWRRPVRPRPCGLALHAPDRDGREGDPASILAGRAEARVRPRQRPLRDGPGHEEGVTAHLRRKRHDPQRHAFLGVLGGDLRPRRYGLLVVARLEVHRLPADRRLRGRRHDVHRLRSGRAARDSPALSANRPAEPGRRHGITDLAGAKTAWMEPSGAAFEYLLAVEWVPTAPPSSSRR